MVEFMPHHAGVVVLTFLATAGLLGIAGLAFLWALASGKQRQAKRILIIGALTGILYTGTLLTYSIASEEKTLGAGQQKYFCEIDCHTAYSVAGVSTAKTLGEGGAQATASGLFYVVTLRTWFDGETISNRRPDGMPLQPNPRVVRVVDEAGTQYATSLAGQKAIVASNVPLTHALKPGESYDTVLVFDLPEGVANPRLLLADWDPVTYLLIGHENSFLHKKIYFGLWEGNSARTQ